MSNVEIRNSASADRDAIEALYPDAFPDEDLLPLVRELLRDPADCLSLVASVDSRIAGHIVFTRCGVEGSRTDVSLLAPLAVAPDCQRQGVGSALVHHGIRRLVADHTQMVFVLGDPAYYGRFGFAPESQVEPPYPLPDDWQSAWQSLLLNQNGARPAGTLRVPAPWMQPALWAA